MRPFRECFGALARRLPPVAGKVAVSCILGIAEVATSLAFVWASKNAVDIAVGSKAGAFAAAVVVFLVITVGRTLFRVLSGWWEGYAVVVARNDIRIKTFAHVMQSVWSGMERFHSADTVNRLEQDISVVTDFVCVTLPAVIVTLIQLIAAAVYLFVLQPGMAWILVLIMPVAVVGSMLFFKRMRRLTGEIRSLDSRIQGHVQENLQHRVLILTLQGISKVMEKLGLLQKDLTRKTVKRLDYAAVSRAFMGLGFTAGYALAFLWGANGLRDGSVTYGMMVAFLQLVGQVQRPVAEITRHVPAFIRALTSEDRLQELTELPLEDGGPDISFESAPGIRIKGLSYSYPASGRDVLKGLDFDFKPGSLTAVMGPTGAGKSTLIRLLLALLKPSSGEIELYEDGKTVPAGVRTRCNFIYVPQGNTLMSGTIRENLLIADPDAGEERMSWALRTAVADFVDGLPDGLDTSCAEVGSGLSEGQAQRIAIARSLLRPGGILVLDEATSALDDETEAELLKRLNGEFRGSKTIICITHRSAATSYADAVLKLNQ